MNKTVKPFVTFLEDKPLSSTLYNYYLADESRSIRMLIRDATPSEEQKNDISHLASRLVNAVRSNKTHGVSVESFLNEFSLDSEEGIALMCLAEALIRVPDSDTARAFISDRLKDGQWQDHSGAHRSIWANASSWGLLLTGRIFNATSEEHDSKIRNMLQRLGSPIALKAVQQAINLISEQFVSGPSIANAYKSTTTNQRYLYSYDMLGENAITEEAANHYFEAYREAISHLGKQNNRDDIDIIKRPSISVNLSALDCRFEALKRSAVNTVKNRLLDLVLHARESNVPITVDAEASWLLEPTLEIFSEVFQDERLANWPYLGLAVQAYQKRANATLLWLKSLAQKKDRKIPVRLIKGAYWDSEIKKAQQLGLSDYPVYTRKSHTDISYLSCAKFILKHHDLFYGKFGTHNAHTIASVHSYAQELKNEAFEFQRFYGMGEPIYKELLSLYPQLECRVYAPVGDHKELLPYLIRRILENGSVGSFLRDFNDPQNVSVDRLVQEPSVLAVETPNDHYTTTPLPKDIFQPRRANSVGLNLDSRQELLEFYQQLEPLLSRQYPGKDQDQPIRNPADRNHILGFRHLSDSKDCTDAMHKVCDYFPKWRVTSPVERAERLERLAELIEEHRVHLMTLLMTEVGKTLVNAHSEVREAIDFCRYYAAEAKAKLVTPTILPGITGEDNILFFEGRGVFLCVSPWNFPLSIFLGQCAAALAAGNTVVAKPSSEAELITRKVCELIYLAGIPEGAFQVVYCPARIFATTLLSDVRVSGLAFTGSLESGTAINIQLAQRKRGVAATVIETGGQNAMIVDSTALPGQVVKDIVKSAFDSGGQRCSALRVLFLQEEIADKVIHLLVERIKTLKVGNPLDPEIDVGPVINENARTALNNHLEYLSEVGRIIAATPVDSEIEKNGYFVSPTIAEIDSMSLLKQEIFGPILHVIRFSPDCWDDVVAQINNADYGLTLGVHTRIESRAHSLARRVRAGNVYINREMIRSTVGSQPFGGLGISGTGPKSGGPNYLIRFAAEKVISNNVAAVGGDLRLLSGGNSAVNSAVK